MKNRVNFLFLICMLIQFSSCIVIYPSEKVQVFDAKRDNAISPLERALARFPVTIENDRKNSLYITVINYKKKLIADIELIDSLNAFYPNYDYFKVTIRDFDKTLFLSSTISLPLRLVEQLDFQKISQSQFRIQTLDSSEIGRSSLLENVIIKGEESDLFYFHSGKLTNAIGSEVNFWAQTDVIATKTLYGAVIIASNFMDNNKSIVDLCKFKVEEAKKKIDCAKPIISLEFYCSPLAKIFTVPIKNNFYRDCTIKSITCK